MAAHSFIFSGKLSIFFLGAVFFCRPGCAQITAGQSGVINLEARAIGSAIEITWVSGSITSAEPYLHYEFQVQKSVDLLIWENVGELFPGGVSTKAAEPYSFQIPEITEAEFYRLAYRLNLPEMDLSGLNFSNANLRNADFSNSNLSGASFSDSFLEGAIFDGALLQGADLYAGAFGQPRLNQLGGAPDGLLSEFLPPIIYWPGFSDFLEEFKGLRGFYVSPSIVLVLLKPEMTVAGFNELLAEYQANLVGSLPGGADEPTLVILEFSTSSHEDLDTLLDSLSLEETVELIARDTLMNTTAIPGRGSDTPPWWSWEVDESTGDDHNWGWEDSRVPQMWNFNEAIEKLDKKDNRLKAIKTGVIDNLIHGEHPDLSPNVVDDLSLITSIEPVREAFDSSFLGSWKYNAGIVHFFIGENSDHGTHVAGIIGAAYGNKVKIDGVNPFARLVLAESAGSPGLGVYGEATLNSVEKAETLVSSVGRTLIDAFSLISAKGVSVLNMSMGYHLADLWEALNQTIWDFESLQAIVQPVIEEQGREFAALAAGKKILIVAAAGNDSYKIHDSNGTSVAMPAELQSPMNWAALKGGAANILVVEGIDQSYELFKLTEEEGGPGGSAIGGNISAPGEGIGSLSYNTEARSLLTGSSQAAPFVTGLAGYLLALRPDLTIDEVKNLIIDNAIADTDGAPRIDAWASALDIDGIKGGTEVLKMLLDIDDGTEDGNLRAEVKDSPTSERSFERVYGSEKDGSDYFEEDADGDGGPGDTAIDMADFRRWRDWLIFGDGKPQALNGKADHDKKDGNGDEEISPGDETTVFPRGDFNGDGIMDRNSTRLMTGALSGKTPTDLQVIIESGLWSKEEDYDVNDLPELIDSVDITVSAKNFFAKYPNIPEGVVAIYDVATEKPIEYGTPKLFTVSDPVHLFTVPTGKSYYVSSEPIETTDDKEDDIKILMVSPAGSSGSFGTIGSYHAKEDERGADFAVDLVYLEMTTKASYEVASESSPLELKFNTPGVASALPKASGAGMEIIESEPEEEMVDAYVPIPDSPGLAGLYGPGSYGARGWANDQGTFYSLARTGIPEGYVRSGDPVEMLTFTSTASWTRTFTKQPGVPDPTFEVEPSRLRVLDGLLDNRDLNALSEIRVEKRVHGAEAGWETVFYSMTEIAGYSIPASGGDHTFEIVDHQGDQPKEELKFIEQFDLQGNLVSTIGAEYYQDDYDGTIPVGDLEDGESFEIRYSLKTRATSVPFDELAEAFIGDPLDYGSGMKMEYGQHGELTRITGFTVGSDSAANVSYRSDSDFYFILTREVPGSEERTQIAFALGQEGTGELIDSDRLPDAQADSYKVENFPLDQPRDTDGDGIDDVYELLRPHLFNPLDATDAEKDSDGDGLSDRAEYERGSDPEIPDVIEPPDGNGHYPGRVVDTELDSGSVRFADVNQDGLLDAIGLGGTFGASELQAALVSPDGVFQSPLSSALGNISPLSFELFQLNDDTIPDAVILADPLTVLLSNGGGIFNSSDSHSFGSILNVASGDFNNDNKVDLFVFRNPDKSLRLLQNNGAGVFTEKAMFTFDSTPWHAATGKWNDDAYMDFAVTLQASQVAVFLGNESGFEEPQFFSGGASAERFGSGDLNGDGFTDIVTANKGRDDISVILANGDGTLAAEVRYPMGDTPRDVLVQDINGDTFLDLLISQGSNFHSLFFGDGTGSFIEQGNIWSSSDSRVVLDDWDGDDIPDLISPAGTGRFLIQPGDGTGSFDARDAIPLTNASIGDIQFANIDGGGEDELLMMNLNTGEIDVWEHGVVSGVRQLLFSLPVPQQLQAFVVMDYNNDTAPDIVALSVDSQFNESAENRLTVFENQEGAFVNVAEIPLSAKFTNVMAAEINGDVLPDILAIARTNDSLTPENDVQALPLLNQGDGQFSPTTPVMPGTGISKVIAKDLNEDGVDELIMNGFFGTAALAVFTRNEDETWSKTQQFNINLADFIVADVDDNGIEELVTTRQSGGLTIETFQITTGAITGPNFLFSPETSADKIRIADVNGDSHADILLGNVDIFLAKPEGGWESEVDRYYTGGTNLAVTDLNQDGRPDLVSWSLSKDSVGLLIHR